MISGETGLVYGLRVRWTVRGLAPGCDPIALLFSGFAGFGADGGRDSPEALEVEGRQSSRGIVFEVEAGDVGAEDAASLAGEEFRPSFFQGNVHAFERDGEVRILAPSARVAVTDDGGRVRAVVDPSTLGERGFVNTTLVIALSIALRHHGFFHLHGGALVRGDGRRVLILGEGGSGKTTLTLSLLDDGALRLGDDTLFFSSRRGLGRIQLFGFPRPFHVAPATARAFPALSVIVPSGDGAGGGDVKSDLPLSAVPGTAASVMDAPHVVLFPRVTRQARTRVLPVSPPDAFGLALSSCALVAADGLGQKAEQLAALRELVGGARAFEIELGEDCLAAPALAGTLIPWPA